MLSNLFSGLPESALPEELTDILLESSGVRIERIVSTGQASDPGFWYDQTEHEWVVLLQGNAAVRFDGIETPFELAAGDVLDIPPHQRHRVEWTDSKQQTIWLAIFIQRRTNYG